MSSTTQTDPSTPDARDTAASTTTLTSPQERASFLEAKLVQVTAETSSIAQEFMTMKEALSNENAYLTQKRDELQQKVDGNQATISKLAKENRKTKERVAKLERKLRNVSDVLSVMSKQRTQLLNRTDEWEDCLMKASIE